MLKIRFTKPKKDFTYYSNKKIFQFKYNLRYGNKVFGWYERDLHKFWKLTEKGLEFFDVGNIDKIHRIIYIVKQKNPFITEFILFHEFTHFLIDILFLDNIKIQRLFDLFTKKMLCSIEEII